jgi:hypothetical protein
MPFNKIKPRLSKRQLFLVPLLIVVLVFSVGFIKSRQEKGLQPANKLNTPSISEPPSLEKEVQNQTIIQTDSKTVNGLVSYLQNKEFYTQALRKFSQRKNQDMWWVSQDKWSIITMPEGQIGLVHPESKNELSLENTFTQQLVNEINTYFLNKGYKKSILNSSTSTSISSGEYSFAGFYDYILGWENENEKCLLTINPDEGSYQEEETSQMIPYDNIYVQCVGNDVFEKAYKEQSPFLKGLNNRTAVLRNISVHNDVASMSINGRRTGASAFMYKTAEGWKEITITQAVPECKELEEKQIPRKYWIDCYKNDSEAMIEPAGEAWPKR